MIIALNSIFSRVRAANTSTRTGIATLKNTIRINGLRRPLVITPISETTERYEIVDGDRRDQALRDLVAEGDGQFAQVECDVRTYPNRAAMVVDRILLNLHKPWTPAERRSLSAFARANGLTETTVSALTGIDASGWSGDEFDLDPPMRLDRLDELAQFVRSHAQSIANSESLIAVLAAVSDYAHGVSDRDLTISRMLSAKAPIGPEYPTPCGVLIRQLNETRIALAAASTSGPSALPQHS